MMVVVPVVGLLRKAVVVVVVMLLSIVSPARVAIVLPVMGAGV